MEVWRGRVTSKINGQIYRAGKLWFTEASTSVKSVPYSTVGTTVNPGDPAVTCDTTYFLPSGYAQLGSDVISYTSKSATQLLGVSGITQSYVGNVYQLFEMPTNMERPNYLNAINVSGQITRSPIPLSDDDTKTFYYQVVHTGNKILLKVVGLDQGKIVEIKYTRKLYDMASDTDVSPFPDSYGTEVISQLVAGEMGMVRGIPTAQSILVNGYGNLRDMYSFYMNESNEVKQSIKPVAMNARQYTYLRG